MTIAVMAIRDSDRINYRLMVMVQGSFLVPSDVGGQTALNKTGKQGDDIIVTIFARSQQWLRAFLFPRYFLARGAS